MFIFIVNCLIYYYGKVDGLEMLLFLKVMIVMIFEMYFLNKLGLFCFGYLFG